MSKHDPASLKALADPRSADADFVNDRVPEPIDPAHRAAVEAGLADMSAGRIASAADIEAVYARFGRGAR